MEWNIELARKEFKKRGLVLLEDTFKSVDTKMKCIAKCGHEKELNLYNCMVGKGLHCRKCSYKVGSSKRKFDYDYVKKYFEEQGCKLISTEYKNWRDKLKYIARCGHENEITFSKFRNQEQGRLCRPCSRPKKEQHFNYNPNKTDEERILNRDYYAIIEWRINVFKRDNYTCQVCGDDRGNNLNAHHLNGYNWDTENRLNVDNGVTLCDTCHNAFHKSFGYGNNTKEQFDNWSWFEGNTEVKHILKDMAHRNA